MFPFIYSFFILFLLHCPNVPPAVPPDIINEDSSVDMAVQEGEDAALTCRATGNPTPRVIWKKEDGDSILIRKGGNRDLLKGETLDTNYFGIAGFRVPARLILLIPILTLYGNGNSKMNENSISIYYMFMISKGPVAHLSFLIFVSLASCTRKQTIDIPYTVFDI